LDASTATTAFEPIKRHPQSPACRRRPSHFLHGAYHHALASATLAVAKVAGGFGRLLSAMMPLLLLKAER